MTASSKDAGNLHPTPGNPVATSIYHHPTTPNIRQYEENVEQLRIDAKE